jgi:hypothetical protein
MAKYGSDGSANALPIIPEIQAAGRCTTPIANASTFRNRPDVESC